MIVNTLTTKVIMERITVTPQAHALPLNKPHATTKNAIPRTIILPPIIAKNSPSNTNMLLFGNEILVPFTSNEKESLEVNVDVLESCKLN